MADGSRIPNDATRFNGYINSSDDYQQAGTPTTNAARLGWSAAQSTDWSDKRVFWRDDLYPKYMDPLQSTGAVKGNVKLFIESFHTFGNPLLNIAAASPNAIHNDEVALNFKIGRHEPVRHTTRISETLVLAAVPKGGSDIHFSARTDIDTGRASKPAGADSLQLAYFIQAPGSSTGPTPPPMPDTSKLPSPDSTSFLKEISTKASFTVHFGTDHSGQVLVVCARWFNTKHPELAGSWSTIVAVIIS